MVTESEDYASSAAPTAHAETHQDGGTDEINVAGLPGELSGTQKSAWSKVSGKPTTFTPSAHASTHEKGGSDEINPDNVKYSRIEKALIVASWAVGASAANNNWLSVCWSPELTLFVAVSMTGTNNRVMTSPDGINWTSRVSASNNDWVSVCWSPELTLFVAVSITGTGNRVMMTLKI